MKIGIVGCGKRFINVYFPILEKLNHELFVWNRSSHKSQEFCKDKKCNVVTSLESFKNILPDLILCFIPSQYQYDILNCLQDLNCNILLETPANDKRILSLQNIGVLEQWPKLPLEQFKNIIYVSDLISRPYMVFNDGRSFDYHAIAQLRTQLSFSLPVYIKGSTNVFNNPGIIDVSGNINLTPHDWTTGQIEMSNGSLLLYNFSYNCKSLLSIPIQFIRSYSTNGSIVTGRMKEIGNDYEFIDIRYQDKPTKEIKVCEITLERKDNVTFSLSLKKENITWVNPYGMLQFDDQQTAIATIIDDAIKGTVYSYNNAYIDYACMQMIKMSGQQQQVIKVS